LDDVREYLNDFVKAVTAERYRQEQLHGEENIDNTPDRWTTILGEEVGEVNKAVLEQDFEGMERELIEVATVCFSIYQRMQKAKNSVRGDSREEFFGRVK